MDLEETVTEEMVKKRLLWHAHMRRINAERTEIDTT